MASVISAFITKDYHRDVKRDRSDGSEDEHANPDRRSNGKPRKHRPRKKPWLTVYQSQREVDNG